MFASGRLKYLPWIKFVDNTFISDNWEQSDHEACDANAREDDDDEQSSETGQIKVG